MEKITIMEKLCDKKSDFENTENYIIYDNYTLCPCCEKYAIEDFSGKGRCQHCMSKLYKKITSVLRKNFTEDDIKDLLTDMEDKLLPAEDIFESIY